MDKQDTGEIQSEPTGQRIKWSCVDNGEQARAIPGFRSSKTRYFCIGGQEKMEVHASKEQTAQRLPSVLFQP